MGKIIREKIKVTGMTCVNCKKKIESRLKSAKGVSKAEVDYRTGILEVFYNKELIDRDGIEKIIVNAGYGVMHDSDKKALLLRALAIAAVILILYGVTEATGVLNLLVPQQLADSSMGYLMLFVTGLLTSVHCVAMCGGINLSQSLSSVKERASSDSAPRTGKMLMPAVLYNAGRVISYTLIGAVLGNGCIRNRRRRLLFSGRRHTIRGKHA